MQRCFIIILMVLSCSFPISAQNNTDNTQYQNDRVGVNEQGLFSPENPVNRTTERISNDNTHEPKKSVLPGNKMVGSKADMTGQSIDPEQDVGSHSGSGGASSTPGQSTIRDPDVPNPNRIRSFEGASGNNGFYTREEETSRAKLRRKTGLRRR